MRISDRMLARNYISSINNQKSEMDKLNEQIATQSKVNRPSDAPSSMAKILNLNSQYDATDTYLKNIGNSINFLNHSSFTMDSLLDEISSIDVKLTEVQNATNKDNLDVYSNEIGLSLDAILELANSKFDGKYVFGGTDFSNKPFSYSESENYVIQNSSDNSGVFSVKTSPSSSQKINISGAELFGTIQKFSGNFDVNSSVGSTNSQTISIYDSEGTENNLEINFTKTADNTYKMLYSVKDLSGNELGNNVSSPTELVFQSSGGALKSVNGRAPKLTNINTADGKVNFNFDFRSLSEKDNSESISVKSNQKMDIFNTIKKIKTDLAEGKLPTDSEVEAVKEFHSKLLGKMSELGTVINKLSETETMLNNQQVELSGLLADEQEVDVVEAVSKLQYYDYMLQVSYKMSASILPKSLVDYI